MHHAYWHIVLCCWTLWCKCWSVNAASDYLIRSTTQVHQHKLTKASEEDGQMKKYIFQEAQRDTGYNRWIMRIYSSLLAVGVSHHDSPIIIFCHSFHTLLNKWERRYSFSLYDQTVFTPLTIDPKERETEQNTTTIAAYRKRLWCKKKPLQSIMMNTIMIFKCHCHKFPFILCTVFPGCIIKTVFGGTCLKFV